MISKNSFFIKNIKNIIFIGYHEKFIELKKICNQNNINFFIITSSDQSKYLKNFEYKVFNKVDKKFKIYVKKNYDIDNTLFVSLGSRLIFKEKDIKNYFKNNLINFHATRLPYDSGGASTSWKIMKNDRIDNQLVHLIDQGIDTGPILQTANSVIPKEYQTPREIDEFSMSNFLIFFELFIKKIKKKKKFKLINQPKYIGNYNPRLNSNVNSWVDWTMSSYELVNFINAFEDPYDGAQTKINNIDVRIKKVQLHGGEISNHPYMSGIISRHDKEWIIVSTKDKNMLIIEEVLNKKKENIINKLKPGDRFISPVKMIFKSKQRVKYSSKGLKRINGRKSKK